MGSHPGEDHCYYHGRVLNPDAAPGGRSIFAISICDGIKGQILTASHDLILEPAHIHIPGHAAVDAIDPDADKLSTEVMVFRRTDHAEPPQLQSLKDFLTPGENSSLVNGDTLAGASHGDLQALLGRTKEGGGDGGRRRLTMRKTAHLQLLVVNDKYRYDEFRSNGGVSAMHEDSIALLNFVAALYKGEFSVELEIILMSQVDYTDSEPYNIPQNPGYKSDMTTVLNTWTDWRAANYDTLPAHDAAHLFSGRDFNYNGLANVGHVCDKVKYCGFEYNGGASILGENQCIFNNGVQICCYKRLATAASKTRKGEGQYWAVTVAHEIGHQLGMNHDGGAGYIMSPSHGGGHIDTWSSYSIEQFNQHIQTFECLFDGTGGGAATDGGGTPSSGGSPPVIQTDSCGDFVVNADEECDCGSSDCSSTDPCCDGSTCKFIAGAQCSALNPCCTSSCAIKPRGTACQDDLGDKGACWGDYCSNRQHSCYGISSDPALFTFAVYGGRIGSDSCPTENSLSGPFTDSSCDAPLECASSDSECLYRGYQLGGYGPLAGYPCGPLGADGTYTKVCDGGDGKGRGSQCVSLSADEGTPTSIVNPPDAVPSPPPPLTSTCGNNVIDAGEQCDCGSSDCSGTDPCCDGSTCKLIAGAQCSALNPCCTSSCAIKPRGTACQDDLGDKGACWGDYCSNRQHSCYGISSDPALFTFAVYGGRIGSDSCPTENSLSGPFTDSSCDAPLECASSDSECLYRGYQLGGYGPLAGYPCGPLGADGTYTKVCNGGTYGKGSQCVDVSSIAPSPPSPTSTVKPPPPAPRPLPSPPPPATPPKSPGSSQCGNNELEGDEECDDDSSCCTEFCTLRDGAQCSSSSVNSSTCCNTASCMYEPSTKVCALDNNPDFSMEQCDKKPSDSIMPYDNNCGMCRRGSCELDKHQMITNDGWSGWCPHSETNPCRVQMEFAFSGGDYICVSSPAKHWPDDTICEANFTSRHHKVCDHGQCNKTVDLGALPDPPTSASKSLKVYASSLATVCISLVLAY